VPEAPQERGPAAYLAELIGTFALVFFITLALSLFVTQPSQLNPNPFIDWSVIGLVHVFVLFMLIQTVAIVSGAHFNPAITVGLAAIRQIRLNDAAMYIVAQLTGGVLGALLTKALVLDEGAAVNYGAPVVSQRLDGQIFPGLVAEGIGTFFLVWAIVGVAVNPGALRDWAGLVIGGTLGLVVMVLGPLTGGSVNPARAFGPALVGHKFEGADTFLLVYVAGPLIGALLAAVIYSYLFILPGRKGPGGMEPVG
jgi:MIP family channel proteins